MADLVLTRRAAAKDVQAILPAAALSPAAYGSLLFLCMPAVVFLLTWIRWPFGLGIAALLLWSLAAMGRRSRLSGDFLSRRTLLCVGAAVVWTILGSGGHFLYANWDWLTRDAVLRDLTLSSWPIAYPSDHHTLLILRAPLGFYLLPALAGKVFGLGVADYALALETACALSLLFALITERTRSLAAAAGMILVFVLFSGMDIIGLGGNILYHSLKAHHLEYPAILFSDQWMHITEWAELFEYSAHSTMLYWVPNHALPGWLGAALWWRLRDDPRILGIFPLVIAAVFVWSPLSAAGLGPFLLFSAWQHRPAIFSQLTLHSLVTPAAVFIPIALFYRINADHVVHGLLFQLVPFRYFLTRYVALIVLEYGLLVAIAWRIKPQPVLALIGALLLVLPLYQLGVSNDFVMRVSIPAIAILSLVIGDMILDRRQTSAHRGLWRALFVILGIGTVVPITETARAFHNPAWSFSTACTTADAWREQLTGVDVVWHDEHTGGDTPHGRLGPLGDTNLPLHYFARADMPVATSLLRKPQLVAPSTHKSGSCWPDYPRR